MKVWLETKLSKDFLAVTWAFYVAPYV